MPTTRKKPLYRMQDTSSYLLNVIRELTDAPKMTEQIAMKMLIKRLKAERKTS